MAPHTGLAAEGVRLKEEYLSALEARISADLAVGRDEGLVGELEAMVREHPFRERLSCYLMVALYRSGRQAEALAAYQRARTLLCTELGLEPGGELRRMEQAVLDHDPGLIAPTTVPSAPTEAIARSPVRYARCPDGVSIAFQVAGDGPIDILAVSGFVSHLDIWWNAPTDRLVRRLTSIGRLISFDKRGMGLSDRPEDVDAAQWLDDAVAVLEAVGSQRAVVLGVSAGAPTALLLASRHPERVQALALVGGFARALAAPDYDVGLDLAIVESFVQNLEANWGTGVAISAYAPSRAKDPGVRDYWARYQQLSASPASATRFLWAALNADVRSVLPTIDVPTLVVHAERDVVVPVGQARYIADRIPGAELVVLDSDVHLICVSDVVDEITEAIDAFIGRVTGTMEPERVLVTVLAVDVTSERRRSEIEAIVERCRGLLQRPPVTATFDGPARALRCATALVRELRAAGHEIAVGLHSGECSPVDGGYRGSAVDVARQLASEAQPGQVLVTQTVRDLVADGGFELEPRGVLSLRGAPVPWETFVLGLTAGSR